LKLLTLRICFTIINFNFHDFTDNQVVSELFFNCWQMYHLLLSIFIKIMFYTVNVKILAFFVIFRISLELKQWKWNYKGQLWYFFRRAKTLFSLVAYPKRELYCFNRFFVAMVRQVTLSILAQLTAWTGGCFETDRVAFCFGCLPYFWGFLKGHTAAIILDGIKIVQNHYPT
jgi:hypothetical protein